MDNEMDFDRLIESNDIKLYSCKNTIAYLNSKVLDYSQAAVEVENPLQVYNDDGNQIGYASIETKNDRLVASIFIDYNTPERLCIENNDSIRYWARPVGFIDMIENAEDNGFMDFGVSPRQVATVFINYLVISITAPRDVRVPSLGEIEL